MATIRIEEQENIALLRFANGVTNAISQEMVAELTDSLAQLRGSCRGLVLAGGEKFFSIGLDLPRLLQLNRRQMDLFWQGFDRVLLDLYTLAVPTAAAIDGHAVAGGTILALTADFRFIGEGRNLMGLNEVNIGVPVPYLADLMLRQLIDARAANEMVFGGELIDPQKAEAIGLVGEIVARQSPETRALETVKALAAKPKHAFGLIKENRTEAVRQRFMQNRDAKRTAMMDCWFRPEVQQMLAEAAKKF